MSGKVAARRAALRDTLIDIAETVIARDGLGALRARDLAKEAGCALGAIYNVFDDLGDIVLAVNARTFQRLGAAVSDALADAPQNPNRRLVVMAQAYHAFAAANYLSWRALFDLVRAPDETAPEWYLAQMGQLMAFIDAPLREIYPEIGAADRNLLTRGLFSSVHGIVLLGLDRASAGVPDSAIDEMLDLLLSRVAS